MMPTQIPLDLNQRSQEVGQNDEHQHQQHLSCEHLFSSPCNNKPAAQQEQKPSASTDIKARLRAIPSPAYHPYIRDRIDQQLDRAISILFPNQINSYHQKQKGCASVSAENTNHSKEATQKESVNVTTKMKRKEEGTKQQFEDSVKKRRLNG